MKHAAIIYERELDIGGVESHLLALFRCVDPEQYRFSIIAPVSPAYQQTIARLGVQVFPIDAYKPLSWRAFQRIRHILRAEQVDLVHAHSPTAAVPARLAAASLDIPAVVTVHIPTIEYHGVLQTVRASSGRRLYVVLDRWLNFNLTSWLIFVSEKVHQLALEKGWAPPGRCTVIPNGIDISQYFDFPDREDRRNALRREWGIPTGQPLIVFLGRLSDQKGLDTLLLSLARLPVERQFSARLIGDGPLTGELESQAKALGLAEQVGFTGRRSDIPACLAAGDLFVLPSRWEAMSISLIEAIASGLPCVVSAVGDNACVIEDGKEGLVIPPGDIPALTTALDTLLQSTDLRQAMGANARRKSTQYSDQEMARQVQAVYDQAQR